MHLQEWGSGWCGPKAPWAWRWETDANTALRPAPPKQSEGSAACAADGEEVRGDGLSLWQFHPEPQWPGQVTTPPGAVGANPRPAQCPRGEGTPLHSPGWPPHTRPHPMAALRSLWQSSWQSASVHVKLHKHLGPPWARRILHRAHPPTRMCNTHTDLTGTQNDGPVTLHYVTMAFTYHCKK